MKFFFSSERIPHTREDTSQRCTADSSSRLVNAQRTALSVTWLAGTVVATFRPQCVSSVRFNDQCHLPTERLSLSVCLDQVQLQLQKTKATPVTENPLNTTPAVLLLPRITFVEHIAKLNAASIVEGNFQERSGKTLVTPQVWSTRSHSILTQGKSILSQHTNS